MLLHVFNYVRNTSFRDNTDYMFTLISNEAVWSFINRHNLFS